MVFGVKRARGWRRWQKLLIAVRGYFKNLCKLIVFEAVIPTSQVTYYTSSSYLFMPNYAPVALLPSEAIKNKFELTLFLGVTYLVNESNFKVIFSYPNYAVRLGLQFDTSFLYEVKISGENVSLSHYNFITQFPTLAPVSSLF